MNLPTLAQLKKELSSLDHKTLIGFLGDLAKLNKDNKTYLYFKLREKDEPGLFLQECIEELDAEFASGYYSNNYHTAKKSAQKIRRTLNKLLSINKDKAVHVELLISFCKSMEEYGYLDFRHPVIDNLYAQQVRKLEKALQSLHEDIQYDYEDTLDELRSHMRAY
ncbi:MAG: hypothetical protein JJU34_16245 [Lunatimonas sp.]|uniref:hypothetical protein n=1 Tax=Lunatimonas sp. TaxID=2060141 RepID=UPI00263B8E64|nr:hypothetical protein [Lunatimonas sp.]MCC5938831.1 hypothetical protein [Lunatimonas sp.]